MTYLVRRLTIASGFAGLAALFQPLLAQGQTPPPAPAAAPSAAPAAPAAPADPSISDRVKKDAASPLYWIRLNAAKTDTAAPVKQAPRIVEVKPVAAAAPKPIPPAPAGGGGTAVAGSGAPPAAVPNPAAAAAATTAANTPTPTSQVPGPAPISAPTNTAAATSQASGGAAAGLAAGAGLAAPSGASASPATDAARTATAPAEEPDDSPLALVKADEPEFPMTVMRRLRKGSVQVRFDVLSDGSVGNVTVVGTTHRSLNDAAIEAVNTWRFQPVRSPRTAVVDLGFDLDS